MFYGNYTLLFQDPSFKDKENAYANLGDNIISLVIDNIYRILGISKERIKYINKDGTKNYTDDYVILLASVNLSDSSLDFRFPMSPRIYPIFISVVANRDVFVDRPDLIEYFKKYSPIGCRDDQTVEIFRFYGIEAYLMGCHTICLPTRTKKPKDGKIFLVDTSEELEKYIPDHLRNRCEYLSHAVKYEEYPVTINENARLNALAQKLLDRYANEAEFVVTSRLHAAAPCIGMGVPVIFACNNIDFRFGWIDKYIKLYSLNEYPLIDWNPQPVELENTKDLLIRHIRNSVNRVIEKRKELFSLSEFYENREKTEFYKLFRMRLEALSNKFSRESSFRYLIWGAGQHCYYAKGLIDEIFPKAKIISIVDKYQTGKRLGVDIISPSEVESVDFDHVFITSVPAKNEAIDKLKMLFGNEAENNYTLIVSQQKS